MKKVFSILVSIFFVIAGIAQHHYTVANAHSHNDYEQKIPFYTAYQAGFGSIEADIFLQGDEILVAHTKDELGLHRTLDSLYLQPLSHYVKSNHGFAYADTSRTLQMMIDVKTEAASTLQKLIEILQHYPELIHTPSIKWVISGERPFPDQFNDYPPFIYFDGDIDKDYNESALSKIAMLSGDITNYTLWNGKSNMPEKEKKTLQQLVSKANRLHKPIRFWGAPDMVNAWYQLMTLGVTYINTDHIDSLASLLTQLKSFDKQSK